jgi:hypothetical protein
MAMFVTNDPLVDALILETPERRFDRAFNVTRLEEDLDQRLWKAGLKPWALPREEA